MPRAHAIEQPDGSLIHPVTVSWDIPTTRENGKAMPITEIANYIIAIKCNARGVEWIVIPDPSTTSVVIAKHIIGNCNIKIKTVDTNDLDSDWSTPINKLIKLDKPKAGGFR